MDIGEARRVEDITNRSAIFVEKICPTDLSGPLNGTADHEGADE
jgi:hypothetical protein